MDVFEVQDQLTDVYTSFTAALVEFRDERIAEVLVEQLTGGGQPRTTSASP